MSWRKDAHHEAFGSGTLLAIVVDPLECPKCKRPMRVIALINAT